MGVDYLFECSFEVANKVGGIYTVLKSKARYMKEKYGDKYFVIGPYIKGKSEYEFEEKEDKRFKKVIDNLSKKGVYIKYGKWTINEEPNCFLIDYEKFMEKKDEIKKEMWEKYGIDSLYAGYDFDEPFVWSYAVGMLIEELNKILDGKKVLHVHEWLSGNALLYLKSRNVSIGKVFTTHATMLGRSMASRDDFYDMIEEGLSKGEVISDDYAKQYGVLAKHHTEKACAHECDVFTTVSDMVARECEFILGKKPDLILYNGINIDKDVSMEDLAYRHNLNKRKIIDFLISYFSPYYPIKVDEDPRIIFISGRYEFKNKGIDLFIDALGKLNESLKREDNPKNVFAFILIPSGINGEKKKVLENKLLYNALTDNVDSVLPDVKKKLIDRFNNGDKLSFEGMDKVLKEANRIATKLKNISKQGLPELCAFDLSYDENTDSIIKRLKERGLLNRKEDYVKVVFYPEYLSKADRLLSLDYNSFVNGCSLGVFPSFYESWGYTPLECSVNGCVSITSDLSGFSQFVKNTEFKGKKGVRVLKRNGLRDEDSAVLLKDMIHEIVYMDKSDIVDEKHSAYKIAQMCDWKAFSLRYFDAHERSLSK